MIRYGLFCDKGRAVFGLASRRVCAGHAHIEMIICIGIGVYDVWIVDCVA